MAQLVCCRCRSGGLEGVLGVGYRVYPWTSSDGGQLAAGAVVGDWLVFLVWGVSARVLLRYQRLITYWSTSSVGGVKATYM